MKPTFRRLLRILAFGLSAVILVALLAVAWGWHGWQRSLPPLDGTLTISELSAPAQLARDEMGVAIITAANARDAARVLGFAHAQDRFFQMDISRRRAAGELAALLGPDAIEADRSARVHRFRALAEQVLEREPPERRALLQAYSEGANAGLASLASPPWEYRLLRAAPKPWQPADSILLIYAMSFDLQETAGAYDLTLTTLRDVLGLGAVNFFNPLIGPADAALDGSTAPLPPPPPPRVINLRTAAAPAANTTSTAPPTRNERLVPGSNAFVVPAAFSATGSALLAGDPHLDLRVPNTWYRAQLRWTGADGEPVQVMGVSIPGVPGIVIGSNGHIAWSLTNSYADTGDLVALDLNPTAPELFYHRAGEMLEFERRTDQISVKGEDPVEVQSFWTVWGPVVGQTERGKNLAYRWTLHDPEAANYRLLEMATAKTLDEAITIAHTAGIPAHNIMIADRDGRAAWTIAGRLPRRFGYDGRFPASWTYGDRGWDGYLAPEDVPVVRASVDRVLWSGNQRKLGEPELSRLGDAGYDEPARARHLRDSLRQFATSGARLEPENFLALQLETEGRWLLRWRDALLATLDEEAVAGNRARAEFRQLVRDASALQAEPASVSYRLMRAWHNELRALTLAPIFARAVQANPTFNYNYLRAEEALWTLHQQEPLHLLAPEHDSWRQLRLAAVDRAIDRLLERSDSLATATWGERNRANIRHPFANVVPFGLADRLNLPADPLPGDKNMPRVQSPSFGASLRLAVSPGHEDRGILHLPGGQSSHPLSPFYLAGHRAWVNGAPVPFLAGEPQHVLELVP